MKADLFGVFSVLLLASIVWTLIEAQDSRTEEFACHVLCRMQCGKERFIQDVCDDKDAPEKCICEDETSRFWWIKQ